MPPSCRSAAVRGMPTSSAPLQPLEMHITCCRLCNCWHVLYQSSRLELAASIDCHKCAPPGCALAWPPLHAGLGSLMQAWQELSGQVEGMHCRTPCSLLPGASQMSSLARALEGTTQWMHHCQGEQPWCPTCAVCFLARRLYTQKAGNV